MLTWPTVAPRVRHSLRSLTRSGSPLAGKSACLCSRPRPWKKKLRKSCGISTDRVDWKHVKDEEAPRVRCYLRCCYGGYGAPCTGCCQRRSDRLPHRGDKAQPASLVLVHPVQPLDRLQGVLHLQEGLRLNSFPKDPNPSDPGFYLIGRVSAMLDA